ncbi:hypothetical protein D1872_313640 [compost metagenome]
MADQLLHIAAHRAECPGKAADFIGASDLDFLGQIASGETFGRIHQHFKRLSDNPAQRVGKEHADHKDDQRNNQTVP